MIEQALRARLLAVQDIADLVDDRMEPSQTRGTFPAIVYETGSTEDPSPGIDGSPSGWWTSEISFTAIAERYVDAQTIGQAIMNNLAPIRWSAELGARVASVTVLSASDDEQDRDGTTPLYLRTVVVEALWTPTT